MLLQTQYKNYKTVLYIVIVLNIFLILGGIIYLIRGKMYEKGINKTVLEINNTRKLVNDLKTNGDYVVYALGNTIYNLDNHINYNALYKYLNYLKNLIIKDIKGYDVSRFILSVDPEKIDIDITLPAYNYIYSSGGFIDLLSTKSFVKKININNFKKEDTGINLKLQLMHK